MRISAVILTKNEEAMIEDCLKSLSWCDEIVVIDDYSEDRTLEIVKNYADNNRDGKLKIYQRHLDNDFAQQRNYGLERASGEWVLFVDADERVTKELKEEIQKQISLSNQSFAAFDIPRRNIRLGGREMRFGGWWPDYVTRLFRKKDLGEWYGEVHESPRVQGKIGKLGNPFLHFGRDLSLIVQKTIEWSEIEADLLFRVHHPPVTWWRLLKVWLVEFWRRFIFLQGFRDGVSGLIEAIYQSFSRFITYVRLWERQNEKNYS